MQDNIIKETSKVPSSASPSTFSTLSSLMLNATTEIPKSTKSHSSLYPSSSSVKPLTTTELSLIEMPVDEIGKTLKVI